MGKGKEKADTSKWNAWEWNEDTQTEYRSRQNVTGEWEYEHRERWNPRTTGPDPVTQYSSVMRNQVENNDNYDDNDGSDYNTSRSQLPSSIGFSSASLGAHGGNLPGQFENNDHEDYPENYDDNQIQQAQLPSSFQGQLSPTRPSSIATSTNLLEFSGSPILSSSAPDSYFGNVSRSVSAGGYSPTGGFRTAPLFMRANSQPNVEVDEIENQLGRTSIGRGRGSGPQIEGPFSTVSSSPPLRRNAGHKPAESSSRNRSEKPDFTDMKVHPSKDWKIGRILKTVWIEPLSTEVTIDDGGLTDVVDKTAINSGKIGYTSVRRFAIIRKFQKHCICLPIATYGYRGTTKKGPSAQDHAVIYINDRKNPGAPQLLEGEPKLSKRAIRVEPRNPRDKLEGASRINFAKLYTLEMNINVQFIGTIHKDSDRNFKKYYNKHHPTLDDKDKNPDIPEEEENAVEYVDDDAGEIGDYDEGYGVQGSHQ